MADINQRPYSSNYSGLVNQTGYGFAMFAICWTGYEAMRYKRRNKGMGKKFKDGLDSVESWEFGYLYQGRCWSARPSPRLPRWPLGWVPQVIMFPEDKLPDMIGIDQTLYLRFLRACWWFAFIHTVTSLPALLPVHVIFAGDTIEPKSMIRASLSSLLQTKPTLLWIHLLLLYWLFVSWVGLLLWLSRGLFRYRKKMIKIAAERLKSDYHTKTLPSAHPHTPNAPDPDHTRDIGLRLRTVMVANVPISLRKEVDLRDYFQYHMSKPILVPAITPGILPRLLNWILRRAPVPHAQTVARMLGEDDSFNGEADVPLIERVVMARKMSELQSQLERREDILRKLEASHIKLAKKVLNAVKERMENPDSELDLEHVTTRRSIVRRHREKEKEKDIERQEESKDIDLAAEEERMKILVEKLGPFVAEFTPLKRKAGKPGPGLQAKLLRRKFLTVDNTSSATNSDNEGANEYPPSPLDGKNEDQPKTVWEVLYSLPRDFLDAYQPLIKVNTLFRGATVPAIDYYTAKLGLLTSLINENRSRSPDEFTPASTAFVTFHNPRDALRATKFLPSHPSNPMACLVTMAPDWRDLDWERVGKSTFTGEFLKDWVVRVGVWAFTLFWVIPVSLFVGLVSIENLGAFIPGLMEYLNKHKYQKEVITAFLPTLLVALLAILIPLILLLIAKKAHNILTLSKLHDQIMTRYYKFLVCNVLVFFCIGTATLNAILKSVKQLGDPLPIIKDAFPVAAPFYVGWLVFQTAMHSGLEIGLYGLPLLVYPSTRASASLRRRSVGIRPRTFNFYYWLPNHVTVLIIVIVFTILNPLVIPFSLIYFSAANTIIKNQLLRVYSKWYDQNGTVIMIRILRYSLDGFLFAEVVFLALNVLLRGDDEPGKANTIFTVNLALTGILMIITTGTKLTLTRWCRAKFEKLDILEADVYHDTQQLAAERGIDPMTVPTVAPESVDSNMTISAKPSAFSSDGETSDREHIASPDRQVEEEPEELNMNNIRFWTLRGIGLASQGGGEYQTLPGRLPGVVHRAKPEDRRLPIPFSLDDTAATSEPDITKRNSMSSIVSGRRRSGSSPISPLRRWTVAGGANVPPIVFPRELSDVVEAPSPSSAITPDGSMVPNSAVPLLQSENERLPSPNEADTALQPPSPPPLQRMTISFEDKKGYPKRQSKKSAGSQATTKSVARSASTRAVGMGSSSVIIMRSPEPMDTFSLKSAPVPENGQVRRKYALVEPHHPVKPWDDWPRHDIPYKNPAYTCTIDSFLWLPRNPLGKLNLDDSVELRRAITIEAGGGDLGEWVEDSPLISDPTKGRSVSVYSLLAAPGTVPNEKDRVSTALSVSTETDLNRMSSFTSGSGIGIGMSDLRRRGSLFSAKSGFTSPARRLNGTEEIALPPKIRARLSAHQADEFGFKYLSRPRGRSFATNAGSDIEEAGEGLKPEGYFTVKRRPSNANQQPGLRIVHSALKRKVSGASSTRSLTRRTSRVISTHLDVNDALESLSRVQTGSSRGETGRPFPEVDPALLPDLHAQSPFADPEMAIVMSTQENTPYDIEGLPTTSNSGAMLGVDELGHAPRSQTPKSRVNTMYGEPISFKEAVVGEVLAEEQVMTARRVKQELNEAERMLKSPRSLLTGWMWRSVPTDAEPAPRPRSTIGGILGGANAEPPEILFAQPPQPPQPLRSSRSMPVTVPRPATSYYSIYNDHDINVEGIHAHDAKSTGDLPVPVPALLVTAHNDQNDPNNEEYANSSRT